MQWQLCYCSNSLKQVYNTGGTLFLLQINRSLFANTLIYNANQNTHIIEADFTLLMNKNPTIEKPH